MNSEVTDWKEQSEALFFMDHLKISDIAQIVKKSRKTVSEHLNTHESYEQEMKFRKEQSEKKRKEYQKNWDRDNRSRDRNYTDSDMLKRCHYEAVNVLSHEKY